MYCPAPISPNALPDFPPTALLPVNIYFTVKILYLALRKPRSQNELPCSILDHRMPNCILWYARQLCAKPHALAVCVHLLNSRLSYMVEHWDAWEFRYDAVKD